MSPDDGPSPEQIELLYIRSMLTISGQELDGKVLSDRIRRRALEPQWQAVQP